MKFKFVLVLITLCLFWTCAHRVGGSLGYELILKPYPSLLLEVGGGEEGCYKKRMLRGEFPSWLINGDYKVLNSGSLESPTRFWEYIRGLSLAFVFIAWFIVILSSLRKGLNMLSKCFSKE